MTDPNTLPTAEQLLERFKSGHLGPAHGIANVLCHIANTFGGAVPQTVLIYLAKELTADLPWPYGGRTPEQAAQDRAELERLDD